MENLTRLEKLIEAAKKEEKIRTKISEESVPYDAVPNVHGSTLRIVYKNKELIFRKNKQGYSPISRAVSMGHAKIVEILCQNGADPTDKNGKGDFPIFIAVSQNNPEMVTTLLNYGGYRCDRKLNPFHVALQKSFKPIVQILLNHVNLVDICSCPCYPDPTFAEEVFNQLLDITGEKDDVKVNTRACKDIALNHAASFGRLYQVQRLVEAGAGVNSKESSDRNTPLHASVNKRHVRVIQYLLTQGADIHAKNRKRCTPLHCASHQDRSCPPDLQRKDFEDSLEIMKILLNHGASVNRFDSCAKTPLHYAVEVQEFWPEKVRLLLDNNAHVNAKKDGDCTPIFFVKCPSILLMLIRKGANVNYRVSNELHGYFVTPLLYAIRENDLTKLNLLLEYGADVNVAIPRDLKRDKRPVLILDLLGRNHEINETVVDRIEDINTAIKWLAQRPIDDKGILPFLVKKYYLRQVTIKSKEFNLKSLELTSASRVFLLLFQDCLNVLRCLELELKFRKFSFDIVVMPINKLRKLSTKAEARLQSVIGMFSITSRMYSDMLIWRFKQALEEKKLITFCSKTLRKIVCRLHNVYLPDLVVYEIIDFLHLEDCKNFAKV